MLGLVSLFTTSCNSKGTILLESPNGTLNLEVQHSGGRLLLDYLIGSDTIITQSPLGLVVNEVDLSENISLISHEFSSFDESWESINGKNPVVRNQYNELVLDCSGSAENAIRFEIIIRSYNDGFAFRYHFPEQEGRDSLAIHAESSRINFRDNFVFWTYNGENHNIGPVRRSESADEFYRIPMVMRTDSEYFLGIHEAEIVRYAPFQLKLERNSFSMGFEIEETEDALPIKTSWRTFIQGSKAVDLLNSNLLVNLNEPCALEDPSWIKPGKAVWDWRVWGYKAEDGFEYGLNTESHLRFVDFAAENNVQYLLIDADWYGPEFSEEADPSSANDRIDIEHLMSYASQRGVGIILYLNDIGAKAFGLERVLKQFSEWGASGVKYGFMVGSMEERVRHTRRVVELCAKYHLTVNFHDGPIPPSGDRRTWPNLITKEFCHSQADAKRSYFPETVVTSTFVNMITGPLDMCNGWFGFDEAISRVRVFEEIPGTVAAEVAKLIVVYSGMNLLSDSPEEYLKKDDIFNAIRKMPGAFDGFEALDGEIGEYIVVARRAGENWFVGSLTNRKPRTIKIDLSFLPEGQKFLATFYEDAPTTHFLNERETYMLRSEIVEAGQELEIRMAPGGGNAIYLERQ